MAEMPRRSGASYREARISYLHYVFDLWVSDDNTIALCQIAPKATPPLPSLVE
jgi:hypothetical protein